MVSFSAKQEQSGEEDFLILQRKLFRVQWPERKLHKKKGDRELERMKAESAEGKKRRVCAPVEEIDQLAFHNVIISERSALVLWVLSDKPFGVAELRIRLGISPANDHEEGGRKSDRFESALLQTIGYYQQGYYKREYSGIYIWLPLSNPAIPPSSVTLFIMQQCNCRRIELS